MFKDIKKFFSDFFKNSKNKSSFKYMPLIITAILVAILVPTIIAVCHTYFGEETVFFSGEDISISLYSKDGDKLAQDSISLTNIDDSHLARMLYELKDEEIADVDGFTLDDSYKYVLHIEVNSVVQIYRCYFFPAADSSYLVTEDRRVFSVNEAKYEAFLNSTYSELIYSSAKLPALITSNGEEVIPSGVEWTYARADGEFVPAVLCKLHEDILLYEMKGLIMLSFSREPSSAEITITDRKDEMIYEGSLDGLHSLTADSDTILRATLTASWEKTQDYDSYGSAQYSFDIRCTSSSSFVLSSDTVRPGSLLTIFAYNIEEGSIPSYELIQDEDSETNIFANNNFTQNSFMSDKAALEFLSTFQPTFTKIGNTLQAFIPIPDNTPSGTFSFSLSIGIFSVNMTVEITESEEPDLIVSTKSKKVINNVTSRTSLYELERLLASIVPMCSQTAYFRSSFLSPEEYSYKSSYSFGDLFVAGGETCDFSALGNAYSSNSKNQNVLSANIGKVIFTGQTLHLGNFVIVDHGMGLCTWYCNLGSIDVAEGDIVAKGQLIGKTGPSSLLDEQGLLILCSVYNTLIDPDEILGKEIKDLSSDPSQEETK